MTLALFCSELDPPRNPTMVAPRDGMSKRGDQEHLVAERSSCDDTFDDATVLERLRANDSDVIGLLIDAYYARLVRYAHTITHDEGATDVVQDVFVALWERRANLDVRGSLMGYLFRAVRNAALNHTRHERALRARAFRAAADASDEMGVPARIVASPSDVLETEEDRRRVHEAIEALPPHYRDVLTLRANGLAYEEIAQVLGVPLKTAQTQGRRGVAMLREHLGVNASGEHA